MAVLKHSWETIGKPGRILVAFSGGADSAALLAALSEIKDSCGFQLYACHINHGLREASEKEEQHALEFARALGVPLDIRNVAVSSAGNLEANARQARYKTLLDAASRHTVDCIALAHHAGDQAETMLMHLMAGSGLAGLSGMKEWNRPFWRPLLTTTKDSLIDFLTSRNLDWVEDGSNLDTSLLRNYLRHRVMPLLEELRPSAQTRMARTAAILDDENGAWEGMERAWLKDNSKNVAPFHFILLKHFIGLHPAFQRRLLRRFCGALGIQMSFEQTEALLHFAVGQKLGKQNLPHHAYAFRTSQRLHIFPDAVKLTMFPWPQPRLESPGKQLKPDRHSQVVNREALTGAFMRGVLPEDTISPLGMSGSQPMAKYLSARRIDRPFRRHWPVFARGHEVLWVPGLGVSRTAAVGESAQDAVKLVIPCNLPDEI